MNVQTKLASGGSLNARRVVRRLLLELIFRVSSIVVFAATLGAWRTWKRNSLALGYWSERSDLDLTLFSPRNKPVPSSLLFLWRFFRRFGEWAVYSASDSEWAFLANPLELERDPKLVSTLQNKSRKPTRGEAFVFWLRMTNADVHLKNQDDPYRTTRADKWNYHRQSIEMATGISCRLDFPAFVSEIHELLSPVPCSDWPKFEALLQPHAWLGQALHEKIATQGIFADQSEPLVEVARSQVLWEIWGLLGQVRLRKNFAEVNLHLGNLADLFPADDRIHPIVEGFCKYLDPSLQEPVSKASSKS